MRRSSMGDDCPTVERRLVHHLASIVLKSGPAVADSLSAPNRYIGRHETLGKEDQRP